MERVSDTALAMAALSICENLLAVMIDRDLLSVEDVAELLEDAAASQHMTQDGNGTGDQAADLIRQIADGLAPEEE